MAHKTSEAKRAYMKAYREVNKETILASRAAHREVTSEYHKEYMRKRQDERRARLNEIKLAAGCRACGYNAHPAALEFNHIGPATKACTVSRCVTGSWEAIEAEIAKCEVLCANCHRIHTITNKQHAPRM